MAKGLCQRSNRSASNPTKSIGAAVAALFFWPLNISEKSAKPSAEPHYHRPLTTAPDQVRVGTAQASNTCSSKTAHERSELTIVIGLHCYCETICRRPGLRAGTCQPTPYNPDHYATDRCTVQQIFDWSISGAAGADLKKCLRKTKKRASVSAGPRQGSWNYDWQNAFRNRPRSRCLFRQRDRQQLKQQPSLEDQHRCRQTG